MDNIPDEAVAIFAAGVAVFLFASLGLSILRRSWKEYESGYVDGAATTLDSIYINMPPQSILYLGILCVAFFLTLVGVVTGNLIVGLVFGLPAFFLPRSALWYLKTRRDDLFGLQLVDALMNISNSLRAGFSLPQALELVHREMPNPMSQEIRVVCQETRLGVPVEDALANLYKRMPLADVDLVVTAIAIVRDVGGNLTEVFDNISHTIRERIRIEGKIRSLTAQGKMQAVVVCMLPFAVAFGLFMFTPDIFNSMLDSPLGWLMFGVIIILEIVGAFFIKKIVTIDV